MAKICITKRTPEKNCQTCAHRKYDQDEQGYYCSANPNWIGEVEWATKEATKCHQ